MMKIAWAPAREEPWPRSTVRPEHQLDESAHPLPGAPDVACRNADTGSDRRPAPLFVRQWGAGNPGRISDGCPRNGHVNNAQKNTGFLPRFGPSRDGSLRHACLIWNYMVGGWFTLQGWGEWVQTSPDADSQGLSISLSFYLSLPFFRRLLPSACLPSLSPPSGIVFLLFAVPPP